MNSGKFQSVRSTHKKPIVFLYTMQWTIPKGNQKSNSIYNSAQKKKICRNKSSQTSERLEQWKLKNIAERNEKRPK